MNFHMYVPNSKLSLLIYVCILQDMVNVPTQYIFGAPIPGLMIAILFFFEHNVASKMAQQKEFNLKNPTTYHYDLFLLGIMVIN